MYTGMQSRMFNWQRAVVSAAAVFITLLLPILAVRAAASKQVLNPALPQILQLMSRELPDDWHPHRLPGGDIHLNNPTQGLMALIDADGIRLKAENGSTLGMQLIRFGFNGHLETPKSGKIRINDTRVEVIHDPDFTEWFINTPIGIEQGFSLMRSFQESPEGIDANTRDLFELHFKLDGDLIPELTDEGLEFKDRSGQVQLHYDQLLAFDADRRVLPARFELAGNQLSICVDTTGAVYPVTIDPLFSSEQSLAASDAAAEDQFGDAVAVDADTIVIGAPLVNSGTKADTGAVYVFVRDPSTGDFVEQQKLTASDAAAEDNFGSAVYVDGHTIIVGAPLVNSGTKVDTGAVYVFTRNPLAASDPWTEQQKLTPSDEAAGDRFGSAVFLEGNTLVGGAPRKDAGTSNATGAAYVFTRDPDSDTDPWSQQQKLTALDASAQDQFGSSVSLSGNTIVVGAPLDNLGTIFDAGSLYVFKRDQTVSANPWTQVQKLTASNAGADDRLGSSVSVDANTILAGAPREDIGGFIESGAAYVFTRQSASSNFSQQQILRAVFPGSDSQFGTSVFVDGAAALIGAPLERFLASTDAGAAYFFARDALSGSWRQQQRLTGSSPEALAEFGAAVGLDAATAVIGSAKRNQGLSTFAGAAFVFDMESLDDEIFQETDRLTAVNAAANDGFASAVGLSGDNTLIGIPVADPGGDVDAGEVSAFERDPDTQVFDDESTLTSNDKAAADNFGSALAVDTDIGVIGAPNSDIGPSAEAGSAYVFNRNSTTGDWDQAVKLTADDDVTAADNFGAAVAIDADIILVGDPFHNPNTAPAAGAAFLFSRDPKDAAPDQWSETDKLTAAGDEDPGDRFGAAVALNSDTALVGAPFENNGGAVFVFVRDPDDNSWTQQQKLTASDASPGDEFGYAVSVFGNTAIIGAPKADVTGVMRAGAVYVFTRDPTDTTSPWAELQKLESPDPATDDAFGSAVALIGNMAVVGAPGVDLPPVGMIMRDDAGAAYDFRRDPDTGQFSIRTELNASDAAADEAFGTAVSAACDTVIVGAPDTDLVGLLIDAGAALVFQPSTAEEDRDGSNSSGSGCFIDTAGFGLPTNAFWHVLAAAIAIALLFFRRLGLIKFNSTGAG